MWFACVAVCICNMLCLTPVGQAHVTDTYTIMAHRDQIVDSDACTLVYMVPGHTSMPYVFAPPPTFRYLSRSLIHAQIHHYTLLSCVLAHLDLKSHTNV